MKVIVIGSGGREHALLWKLASNAEVKELLACPGNGGTGVIAKSIAPSAPGIDALAELLRRERPDLVVVGPEQPLADGIVDRLQNDNILCFGPSAKAAQIEASKMFSKELMRAAGVPTAEFIVCDEFDAAKKFILQNPREQGRVIKADGLAAGKGAFVCNRDEDALVVLKLLLNDGMLGTAGQRVVIEEMLTGVEASAHFWCDGKRFAALPVARDYKRAFDGDEGANTGGMGTYCPANHVTSEALRQVEQEIVAPTLRALAERGAAYRGVLYVGLMITPSGPQVIEFNCRFGDPETQVMLPVMQGDMLSIMLDCAQGTLKPENVKSDASGAAVCVVLAAEGYPASYPKGIALKRVKENAKQITFHAGTKIDAGNLVSSGGRVLNAVGLGKDIPEARTNAYELAEKLSATSLRFRRDIAEQTEVFV